MMNPRMSRPHSALALAVIVIWGANFVVMKWGLDRLPPLALCAWRFFLSFVPACFFLPVPAGRWRLLTAVGVLTGLGQFGLLCIAMRGLISPGIASIVVQTQAFFTVALAAFLLRETVRPAQIIGCLIAATGLGIIAMNAGTSATLGGVALVLLAALSWAICNVLIKASAYSGDLVAFIVWSSLFAALALAGLSLIFEGAEPLMSPIMRPEGGVWMIFVWQAYANTIFGYAAWNTLIRKYSLSRIGPLTLLVPIVAMAFAALLIGEKLQSWKLLAGVLIISGVAAPFLVGLWKKERSSPAPG
jgi:O-acetylserine/cysteine efflux transporter